MNNPDNYKVKRILNLVSKQEPVTFSEEELKQAQDERTDVIARGLEKYNDFAQQRKNDKNTGS
ncbi:hypothetical protein C900_00519 [Fulvivirga imtechensis AK7]|uniref:Uncharacterized protein n=1 Tax=Fulvivirga imtechensis AK7 TaxID=1237149 RepID=L8JHK7_9BACT|nr:hypothetical protein [Fulvivirga imtechensis]ELR68331.1 hypothetical protein C900_00519 [Fulvivirga imtechensis AK7]